jgi:hypothetical protein
MKIRVFNIDYLFENDSKYQHEYLTDFIESEEGMTYDEAYQKEIDYLNTIREIVLEYDQVVDMNDIAESLTDYTGEYIQNFEYETLVN